MNIRRSLFLSPILLAFTQQYLSLSIHLFEFLTNNFEMPVVFQALYKQHMCIILLKSYNYPKRCLLHFNFEDEEIKPCSR